MSLIEYSRKVDVLSMNRKKYFFTLVIVAVLFVSGCGGNNRNNTEKRPFEPLQRIIVPPTILPMALPRPQIKRITELSSDTQPYDEVFYFDTCNDMTASETIVHRGSTTTIEGGAEFYVQRTIEDVVSEKYNQHRSILDGQLLVAPPGTKMEIKLRWSEEIHSGNVTAYVDSSPVGYTEKTYTYTVRIPIAVEQVASREYKCP